MKNKKGFTLVEILSTIVLIALLLGLGVPGVMKIRENMNKRAYNTKVDLIEQAAVLWGQDNKTRLQSDDCIIDGNEYKCKKISIDNLIGDDYLEADGKDGGKYIYNNPKDNSNIVNTCVFIYKKNNRVYSFYPENDTSCIEEPSGGSPEGGGTPEGDAKYLNKTIIANAKSTELTYENKTVYSDTLQSTPAEEISGEDERLLLETEDDHGTSYYFRGNVIDNYVTFANMCWRIVRIAGDGSTKLILEDRYTTCNDTETETTSAVYTGNWSLNGGNYGYEETNVEGPYYPEWIMNYLNPVTNNTSSMVKAFYDFQTTKLVHYTSKIKSGDWCLGDKAYGRSYSLGSYSYTYLEEYNYSIYMYYDAYTRLSGENKDGYQPTLKCNGTKLQEFANVSGVSSKAPMYVSAITADEIVYAGGKVDAIDTVGTGNSNYYLLNNYQKSNSIFFKALSPSYFGPYGNDMVFYVHSDGRLDSCHLGYVGSFRPVVSLLSSAEITEGIGTIENPYVIK